MAYDLSDPEGGRALVAATEAAYGPPNIVIANAGTTFRMALLDVTLDDFDEAVRVNLRGAFLLAQAALPRMATHESSRFIFIASAIVHAGAAMSSLYTMTKSALHGLMLALVPEWGASGVTFNVIDPGWVITPLSEASTGTDDGRAKLLPHHPNGRLGVPMDIAHAAVMFADEHAGHINGQAIVVDGGNLRTAKSSPLPPRYTGEATA